MSASRTAIDPNIVGVYGQGLFKTKDPSLNNQQLKALQGSGFNTVFLFALHVWPTGELYYGTIPICQNGKISKLANPDLPALVTGLRRGGADQVLITVGSADADDYQHIQALLKNPKGTETLRQNFSAFAHPRISSAKTGSVDGLGCPRHFRRLVISAVNLLSHVLHLVGEVPAGSGRWQRLPVFFVELNDFLNDLAQFTEDFPLVRAMATSVKQARRAAYEALILLGPFHDLRVSSGICHAFDSLIAISTART